VYIAKKEAVNRRRFRAAKILQRAERRRAAQQFLKSAVAAASVISRTWRFRILRNRTADHRKVQATVHLQSLWRTVSSSRKFRRYLHAIALINRTIQSFHRCRIAKRFLCDLREASRNLANVINERDKLRHSLKLANQSAEVAAVHFAKLQEENIKLREINVRLTHEPSRSFTRPSSPDSTISHELRDGPSKSPTLFDECSDFSRLKKSCGTESCAHYNIAQVSSSSVEASAEPHMIDSYVRNLHLSEHGLCSRHRASDSRIRTSRAADTSSNCTRDDNPPSLDIIQEVTLSRSDYLHLLSENAALKEDVLTITLRNGNIRELQYENLREEMEFYRVRIV
jgi:myosin heavy subunit